MNFNKREIGDLWVLASLEEGPRKAEFWWPRHLRAMREAGLVRPALRLHRGWELTDKARAYLKSLVRT